MSADGRALRTRILTSPASQALSVVG